MLNYNSKILIPQERYFLIGQQLKSIVDFPGNNAKEIGDLGKTFNNFQEKAPLKGKEESKILNSVITQDEG